MQFRVPQFIEIEDKIFGPFTFKQFVYLIGGAGLAFLVYKVLPIWISPLFIVPVVGFALALAFYKVNNKPFIAVVESAVRYFLAQKLYIWKKMARKPDSKATESSSQASAFVPKLSDSRLKDLSWSLDVLDVNKGKAKEEERP